MKKGYLTDKQLNRFKRIGKFIKKHKKFPTNLQVSKMFKVTVGETSSDILKKYRNSLNKCPICNHKIKYE